MSSRLARGNVEEPVRVLVVGVAEQIRSAMAALAAENEDLTVVWVETIAQAADRLEDEPGFDAVVSEPDLLDGSSVELLERIRDRDPDLPVVLFGSQLSPAIERRAIAAGATDVVRAEQESASREALQARLERAVGRYWARRRRRARQRYVQALVTAAPDAILVIDESSTISFANPAIADVFGYAPEELLGESMTVLMSEQEAQRHLDAVERYHETEERHLDWEFVELPGQHRDGRELQLTISLGEFTQNGRRFFVGVVRDATDREADRREREAQLEAQSARLERLDRITDELLRVERAITRAETRQDLERGVCEELVDAGPFAFAWIGDVDAREETIRPRARAGRDRGYLGGVDFDASTEDAEPAVRTARSRSPTVVNEISAAPRTAPWREEALACEFRSVVSVPLLEADRLHGVLTVYATEAEAFDTLSQRVFEGVADAVARGIGALEREQALLADTVVELSLRLVGGDDLFGRVARETGATVELKGVVPREDSMLLFLVVRDAPAGRVRSTLEADPAVSAVEHVGRSGTDRFEVTVDGEPLLTRLVEEAATLGGITATADDTRLQIALPVNADVREVIEALRADYSGVYLLSRTERPQEFLDEQSFRATLERRLTDRQLEALNTAFLGGYFDWPREHTSEEIADLLGVSQPTFNHHLRIAERKLLSMLFGDGDN